MSLSKVSHHPTNVYFYRGVVDPTALLTNKRVETAIKEILTKDTGVGNVEKLTGHEIYSYRIDKTGRLLFKPISLRGKCFLLILDYLPNHEYGKSKFLKPSIAKKFINQAEESLKTKNCDEALCTELSEFLKINEGDTENLQVIYRPADFYASNFIELDPIQESSITAQTPLIINGPPGSGKSCVAICGVIANYVATAPDDGYRKRVLYICSQRSLANIMQLHWKQSPFSKREHCTVEFWSYQEFLSTNLGDAFPKQGKITPERINTWFDKEYKLLAKLSKVHGSAFKMEKQHLKLLFEEFQIISILNDQVQYLDLGEKECHFFNEADKNSVWDLFTNYKQMLEEEKWYDERFFQIPKELLPEIDLIFNDEAADLAPFTYKQLIEMAREHNIIFSLDTNQDTSGNFSKRVQMQAVFNNLKIPFHSISLSSTYRCAQRIVEVANRCLDIKACFKKGTSDREEDRSIKYAGHNLTPGLVMRVDAFSIIEIYEQILEKGYKATDVAIISTDKEMKKKLGIALVFTPDEIKGNEYKVIILDNPLQSDGFKKLNSALNQPNQQQYLHRPKTQSSLSQKQLESEISPAMNALYVSMTRALELLVLRQDKTHDNANIIEKLEIGQTITTLDQIPTSLSQGSSKEEWLNEARRLWTNGNKEQFEAICQYHLQLTPQKVLEKFNPVSITQASQTSSLSNPQREKLETTKSVKTVPSLKKGAPQPIKNKRKTGGKRKNRISKNKKDKNITLAPASTISANTGVKELSKNDSNMLDASENGNIDCVRNCLEKGANVNAADHQGYTALILASHQGHTAIVKLLLECKADVNAATTHEGATPLISASQQGHVEIVQLLLQNKANVNALTHDGGGPLMSASQEGHVEIVQLLLQNKANVNALTHDGGGPLILASNRGHTNVVELLLNSKANVNAKNHQWSTSLMGASDQGYTNVVKLLLERGADVNIATHNGFVALMIASLKGHANIVQLLLENGAHVNAVDNTSYTSLILAAYSGHLAVVELLLKNKARVDIATLKGTTPLMFASQEGHVEIVQLLLANGANPKMVDKTDLTGIM